jgi:hypothetical protein
MVKDIFPGQESSFPPFPRPMADVNGTLFFIANDGIHVKGALIPIVVLTRGLHGSVRLVRNPGTVPMMGDGFLMRSGGETWGPVSPDNVQETGVSPGGRSGSPIVTAEAEQVERTRRKPCSRPRSDVFVPYRVSSVVCYSWIRNRTYRRTPRRTCEASLFPGSPPYVGVRRPSPTLMNW